MSYTVEFLPAHDETVKTLQKKMNDAIILFDKAYEAVKDYRDNIIDLMKNPMMFCRQDSWIFTNRPFIDDVESEDYFSSPVPDRKRMNRVNENLKDAKFIERMTSLLSREDMMLSNLVEDTSDSLYNEYMLLNRLIPDKSLNPFYPLDRIVQYEPHKFDDEIYVAIFNDPKNEKHLEYKYFYSQKSGVFNIDFNKFAPEINSFIEVIEFDKLMNILGKVQNRGDRYYYTSITNKKYRYDWELLSVFTFYKDTRTFKQVDPKCLIKKRTIELFDACKIPYPHIDSILGKWDTGKRYLIKDMRGSLPGTAPRTIGSLREFPLETDENDFARALISTPIFFDEVVFSLIDRFGVEITDDKIARLECFHCNKNAGELLNLNSEERAFVKNSILNGDNVYKLEIYSNINCFLKVKLDQKVQNDKLPNIFDSNIAKVQPQVRYLEKDSVKNADYITPQLYGFIIPFEYNVTVSPTQDLRNLINFYHVIHDDINDITKVKKCLFSDILSVNVLRYSHKESGEVVDVTQLGNPGGDPSPSPIYDHTYALSIIFAHTIPVYSYFDFNIVINPGAFVVFSGNQRFTNPLMSISLFVKAVKGPRYNNESLHQYICKIVPDWKNQKNICNLFNNDPCLINKRCLVSKISNDNYNICIEPFPRGDFKFRKFREMRGCDDIRLYLIRKDGNVNTKSTRIVRNTDIKFANGNIIFGVNLDKISNVIGEYLLECTIPFVIIETDKERELVKDFKMMIDLAIHFKS